MSKKWLSATFFEKFRLSLSPYDSRAGKPAKKENPTVFIRSAAHENRMGR